MDKRCMMTVMMNQRPQNKIKIKKEKKSYLFSMWRHPCLLDFSSTGVYAHKNYYSECHFLSYRNLGTLLVHWKNNPQKMTCKWCGRIVKRFFTLSIGNIIFPNWKAKCCFSSEICAIFIWKILVVQKRQVEEGNKVQWTAAAGHVITPPVLMIYWGPSASHLMLLYYIWWHIISTERQRE